MPPPEQSKTCSICETYTFHWKKKQICAKMESNEYVPWISPHPASTPGCTTWPGTGWEAPWDPLYTGTGEPPDAHRAKVSHREEMEGGTRTRERSKLQSKAALEMNWDLNLHPKLTLPATKNLALAINIDTWKLHDGVIGEWRLWRHFRLIN